MIERHKELYDYLVERGNEWTSQADIGMDLDVYGNAKSYLAPKEYHNTNERILLTRDIREINASAEFEKLIISSSKGVKLATEQEFGKFISEQYKATIRKLSRIYKMAKKGNLHNQIGIDGTVVEAFLDNCENLDENFLETT